MTDNELIERFRKTRDETAFRELYERYFHLAKGTAMKLLKDEEASNEIVARVFAYLYEKIPTTDIQSFNAYLYSTVRNECLACMRKERAERQARERAMEEEFFGEAFMENEAYRNLFHEEPDLEAELYRALTDLSEPQRKCIELFFFEKMSYSEIQRATGYNFKQVKSYLQNGKRNLKIALKKFVGK